MRIEASAVSLRRATRRAGAAVLLALSVAVWLGVLAFFAQGPPAATASRVRNVEMFIAYPSGGEWEIVRIALLLEDDGGDFAAIEAAARAERLARFPGGVELAPEVSAQYATFGWVLEGHTAMWWYNPEDNPGRLEDEYAVFAGGAAAWNYAAGTDFHFEEGGTTTADLGVCLGDGRDGQNTVGWRQLQEPTLAETCSLMTPGAPQEFDIQFSSVSPWTLDTTGVKIDLQSVAIHEFGHALGLKHSSVSGSVMYSGYRRGTVLREPTADDLAGLHAIYGDATTTPTPTPGSGGPLAPQGIIPALSRQ